MCLIPVDAALDDVHLVRELTDAVAFSWVAHHDRLDADIVKRNIELLGLRDGNIIVVLAMQKHDRRAHTGDMLQR